MSTSTAVAQSLRGLDPEWFGAALDATVTTAIVEPMAITGASADIARVRLEYGQGSSGPATVIAKIRGRDPLRTAMDEALGLYAREARFYDDFAAEVPIRTPRCFHVGDGTDTPLLLEDLGDLRAGDQTVGLELADAERVIDDLAALHVKYWASPALDAGWLAEPAAGVYGAMSVQLMSTGLPVLQERYSGRGLDDGIAAVAEAIPRWADVLRACTEGPQTMAHNDCRLDNMFFDGDDCPVLVDWQVVARTRGTQDVANLLAGSMEPSVSSRCWEDLLRRYHAGLSEHGVRDYTWSRCVDDYRQNTLYPLGAGLAALGALDLGERGAVIGELMVLRPLAHCVELDAFGTV